VKSFLEIIKVMYELFSQTNARRLIKVITNYHRVPGSRGIIDAAYELEKWLRSYGISVETKYFKVDGELKYFAYTTPIGWDIYDGEVRIIKPKEELLHRFIDSPTMVLTYSPPGDVEGEVVYVRRGVYDEDYKDVNVEGKIVLAYGSPRYAYRQACKRGAIGFIYYSKNGAYEGVPYASVRLLKKEIKEYKIPAVSISRKSADRIISNIEKGERVVVRISVKSEIKDEAQIPVVISGVEGKENKEIWLTAHLCHPAPGANDNASGVTALVEGLRAYYDLLNKGAIERPRYNLRIIWTAEWLGFLAYMNELGLDYMKNNVIMGINLDMVGGDEVKTNSILRVKNPPILLHSILSMFGEEALKIIASKELKPYHRYSVDIYSCGSDHDLLIALKIPSIMLITWPDTYYHTDLDRVDNLNFSNIAKCSAVAYAIPQYISTIEKYGKEIIEAVFHYALRTYSTHIIDTTIRGKTSVIESQLRELHIAKHIPLLLRDLNKFIKGKTSIDEYVNKLMRIIDVEEISDEEIIKELKIEKHRDYLWKKIKLNYKIILLLREVLEKLPLEDREKLLKISESLGDTLRILMYLTLSEGKTVLDFIKVYTSEVGKKDYDKLIEFIKLIEKSDYIRLT